MTTEPKPFQKLTIKQDQGENRIFASCDRLGAGTKYVFALMKNGKEVSRYHPSYNNTSCFYITQAGEYCVKAAAMNEEGVFARGRGKFLSFADREAARKYKNEALSPLKSLQKVLREVWSNKETMLRIAFYDYRLMNKDSYLGKLWSVINPLIQIFTYWLVFGLGLRSGQPVDGHPFILWMLCGIVPWFFINQAIVDGCNAIYNKAGMVLRMQYPLATLPVKSIFSAFFEHAVTMALLLIVLLCAGIAPGWSWLCVLYYQAYMIIFLSSLALITSTLTMLARDYQKLVMALLRLLFYITPILWTPEKMPESIQKILLLNPFYYCVNGYRDSLLYHRVFWMEPQKMLFFWALALLMLILGSWLHCRHRDQFNDML